MPLPININKLLKGRIIEWDRLEFKKGWNPEEVIRTICAFANDINNWGGGYIVIGVDEIDGKPVFPPIGLQENQIDRIQKELVELCHKIEPHYTPVTEPVFYEGQLIFILWVPGGEVRPYKAPQTLGGKVQKRIYIRQGSVTKPATKEEERFLHTISIALPFDDRINHEASIHDLDKDLMTEFLYSVDSELYKEASDIGKEELALRMQLLKGSKEYLRPINAALLFFNPEPHKFFRGAISEVVVNAYYHRSYDNVSPIEISVYPDKMVVLSFPGPLPPVDKEMLKKKKIMSREYRNRRIGDFLKELDLTEGRGTGFPIVYGQMAQNGSPEPVFETDDIHTHFLAVLPVHPEFLKEKTEDSNIKTDLSKLDSPKALDILAFCKEAKSRMEIMNMLGLYNNTKNFDRYIKPLLVNNILLLTLPQKPSSSKQQYYTSELS